MPRPSAAVVSTALEVAGLVAVTTGVSLLAPWAGLVVGGVLLVVAGVALDLRERR